MYSRVIILFQDARVLAFIGTWGWSRGWHPARSKGAASTRRRRSPARVWSVQRVPKRTVRTRTWPPSSRQYAPARHPSCRYLPRRGPKGLAAFFSLSLSLFLSRINARGSTRLIRFAGPTTDRVPNQCIAGLRRPIEIFRIASEKAFGR